jgi:membrane protein DedA with SNARE-associated domain
MEEFIRNYGYLGVFLGACIEGETILLAAGCACYFGYLNLITVMITAFFGTLIADQVCYHIGRFYGPALLQKYPKVAEKADRVFYLLKKYDAWFMMSFRFIYGIRIASPLIIGASGITPSRFTWFNFPAALVWAIIVAGCGYIFAESILWFIDNIIEYQKYVAGSIVLVIAGWFTYKNIVKK